MSESLKKELETLCLDILKSTHNDYDQLLDWSYALQEKIIVLRHLAANNAPQINNYIKGEEAPKKELFVIEEQEKKEDIKPKEETHFQKIEVSKREREEESYQNQTIINTEPQKEANEYNEVVKEEVTESIKKEEAIIEAPSTKETSNDFLNKKFASGEMKVGLNDRIAFVKHLFRQSTEDFNRVLSQINSFESYDETLIFLDHMVAPEYGWRDKQEYVKRFKVLVAMRFGVELNEDEA